MIAGVGVGAATVAGVVDWTLTIFIWCIRAAMHRAAAATASQNGIWKLVETNALMLKPKGIICDGNVKAAFDEPINGMLTP